MASSRSYLFGRGASRFAIAVSFAIASFIAVSCLTASWAMAEEPAAPVVTTNLKDGLVYVWIPSGKFTMGCAPKDADCFDNEKKVHETTLTAGFWMGRTDVTQEAYVRVNGRNPSHFKGKELPVESVNWAEAQNYCQAIGGRLPTEAEWEYAARGGDATARYGAAREISWNRENSGNKTRAVAQKKANAFGLYDLLGDVWQWTSDWYGDYPGTPATDPQNAAPSNGRVVRGGSWSDSLRFARASAREGAPPADRYDTIGFRCVSTPVFTTADRIVAATGGDGSIDLTVPAGSEWKAASSADWITFVGPAAGVGNATLKYHVGPNPGAHRAAMVSITNSSFTVEQLAGANAGLHLVGSMPDTVAEENWKTTFTFVNKGETPVEASLRLFDDAGGPLALPLRVPGRSAAQGPMQGPGVDRTVAAHAAITIETAGAQTPPLQVGSAQLYGSGPLDGFAIFHLIPGAQEAVAPLETGDAKSYTLAFDNTGGAGLGVALANLSPRDASIEFILRDDKGARLQTGTLALAGSGHTSFVVATQYPASAGMRGTLELVTPAGGRISALGLRTTTFQAAQAQTMTTTLTSIPALPGAAKGRGSFAHIAGGAGWQTTLVLVNMGSGPAQADLAFFGDSGSALSLPLEFPQSTGTQAAAFTLQRTSVHRTIEAGAMLVVRSTGPDAITGSAQLSTDGNVGGFAILRYDPNGQEAVVPLEDREAKGYILAYDNTGGTTTGVAISTAAANGAAAGAVRIQVVIRDESGEQVGTGAVDLAANGHTSFLLAEQFPQSFDRRGSVEFNAPDGARIGVIGIRTPMTHTFTTLPALAK